MVARAAAKAPTQRAAPTLRVAAPATSTRPKCQMLRENNFKNNLICRFVVLMVVLKMEMLQNQKQHIVDFGDDFVETK